MPNPLFFGSVAAAIAFLILPPCASAATDPAGGTKKDAVFYFGTDTELHASLPLSDGTVLVAGGSKSLDWLPAGIQTTALTGDFPSTLASGRTAWLCRMDATVGKVLGFLTLPPGFAEHVTFLKSTNIPGQATGAILISGRLTLPEKASKSDPGYFIARLDANFVDAVPKALEWITLINATSSLADSQPWDVDATGNVVYATGDPHSYDWMAVNALDQKGQPRVVPHWPRHWSEESEMEGTPDLWPAPAKYSAIILKTQGRGDFRSLNAADFSLESSDGNGGIKKGKWPFDAMFDGFFNTETRKTEKILPDGKGYHGYRWGNTPCANVGAIAIDRRNGTMFIGGNNKSKLPEGEPDFEPWVVAMDVEGKLMWWQRLYPESAGTSTPDQYVDALAIDYNATPALGDLIVVARCHGNNTNNLWQGDKILANKGAPGFQKQFTGTNGNAHYSWLGRMTSQEGEMRHATYIAEFNEGAKVDKNTYSDPLLSTWPRFDAGWPDLNTTKVRSTVQVDPAGRILIAGTGRRVLTTSNAFQKMPSPLADPEAKGSWSDFVRVYRADLSGTDYSSLVSGAWDWTTGQGGGNVTLDSVCFFKDGILTLGHTSTEKESETPAGAEVPLRNAPAWATPARKGQTGIIARFYF